MRMKRHSRRAGQTTAEYSAVMAMFLLAALMLLALLSAFNEYGQRILSLVGLDYP